jgi:hypothetical protein
MKAASILTTPQVTTMHVASILVNTVAAIDEGCIDRRGAVADFIDAIATVGEGSIDSGNAVGIVINAIATIDEGCIDFDDAAGHDDARYIDFLVTP